MKRSSNTQSVFGKGLVICYPCFEKGLCSYKQSIFEKVNLFAVPALDRSSDINTVEREVSGWSLQCKHNHDIKE